MGIIKAVKQAIGGGFADTWQEVIEPDNIGDQTVYARGVLVNRGQNKKGSDDIVSNGSIIHVYDNQFMILVDGGKIVDYTAELLQGEQFIYAITFQRTVWGFFKGNL